MNEEQIKYMILKQCLELTTNNDFRPPISAYDGIDIDDVVRTCKQLQDKKTYLDLVKENQELKKENEQLKEEKRKVRDYINKHCVNEKISKEVGYKCYTMADTNELEKIMKILGDDK